MGLIFGGAIANFILLLVSEEQGGDHVRTCALGVRSLLLYGGAQLL